MTVRARHLEALGSMAFLVMGITVFMGDWATTMPAYSAMPGLIAEANPLARPIIAAGPVCAFVVKVPGSAGAVVIFLVARRLELRRLVLAHRHAPL